MALVLYVGTKHLSSWSLRPFLALVQSGLPFETRTIALDRPTSRADILRVTPSGKVPVLHDGDLAIWDSLAICEYLAERVPSLWPADRVARARARTISAEMHSGFAALRQHMPMQLLEPRHGQGHTPDALADAARVQAIWRDALGRSGGPLLFGDFSIADAMFAPVVTRFQTYGVELDASCRAYVASVEALPAMKRWRAES
jgi:glutathione S-transferase